MDSEIWAFMVHLGCNCWADHKVDHWGDSVGIQAESHSPEDYLRFDEEEWQFLTSRIAAMGGNLRSGKIRSAVAAVFLPTERMKAQFPVLQKG